MINLSSLDHVQSDQKPCPWWIDKHLLEYPKVYSNEALVFSEPVSKKLLSCLSDTTKQLNEKSQYVFSMVKDVFSYRNKLEQLYHSVKNSKVPLSSLENVQVLGFDFNVCETYISNMTNSVGSITKCLKQKPISLSEELPNLSDEDIKVSVSELTMEVSAKSTTFFSKLTRNRLDSAVDSLLSLDRSLEAMGSLSSLVSADANTYGSPISELSKHETVDVADVHTAVDAVNKRITEVNHLLNATFLLQMYNKVINVVFLDAIANLKEG